MKLTIEQIANHSPCGDGAKWFREFYPNGLDLVSWVFDEDVKSPAEVLADGALGFAVAMDDRGFWVAGDNLMDVHLFL